MQDLFVVIRCYGPPYARGLRLEEQQDWEAHAAFMDALEAEGLVCLGGPLEGREERSSRLPREGQRRNRTASR